MKKIRTTPAWDAWLRGLADHCRVTEAVAIEQALYRYAEGVGWNVPPPRRNSVHPRRRPTLAAQIRAETAAYHQVVAPEPED